MDRAELAARFAPILWIHETDHHLPEDWRAFFDAGTVQLCHDRESVRTIGSVQEFLDIPDDLNTPEHALDIRELDLESLVIESDWPAIIGGVGGQGLECVREGACKALGNNRHVNTGWYNSARAAAYQPRVYWRAFDDVTIPPGIPGLSEGPCQLVQYFFWTIYNDHFNQHEGDWDATMQVFVSHSGEALAASHSFHEDTWLVRPPSKVQTVPEWLSGWGDTAAVAQQTEDGILPVWNATPGTHGTHLWNFIASGSHGGYPTPGYTTTVAPLPEIPGVSEGGRLRISTDDRAIGQTCIYPSFSLGEDAIRTQLLQGNITDKRLRGIGYSMDALEEADEVVGFARWRGHWGEVVDSPSWSGPLGPTHQEKWTPGSDTWSAYLRRANRFGTPMAQIDHSFHGVRTHDLA